MQQIMHFPPNKRQIDIRIDCANGVKLFATGEHRKKFFLPELSMCMKTKGNHFTFMFGSYTY